MTPVYALPPLPAVQPDAAANDRFPVRLRRADLAVVHGRAPAFDDRKMAGPTRKVAFDRKSILNKVRP